MILAHRIAALNGQMRASTVTAAQATPAAPAAPAPDDPALIRMLVWRLETAGYEVQLTKRAA
jgi:hypothetical protein